MRGGCSPGPVTAPLDTVSMTTVILTLGAFLPLCFLYNCDNFMRLLAFVSQWGRFFSVTELS